MINIGVLGCGTVASGVYRLLQNNRYNIIKQAGEDVVIKRILARTPEKALELGIRPEQICSDIEPIINDPDISVVVELIGGVDDAYTFVRRALMAKKHVVTANKDLLAQSFTELYTLANENGVSLSFEASVGGGIPLIGPLYRTLAASPVDSITGILNGTTNYILTCMSRDGIGYAEALQRAQQLGYAEANPTADVDGFDAARKIAILASLAFHSTVTASDVDCTGISAITKTDIDFAASNGFAVKLLAMGKHDENGISVSVRPALVPLSHPLASVSDAYNAVFLSGKGLGDVMLYGQGAGAAPTAGSVVGDILEICRRGKDSGSLSVSSLIYEDLPIVDAGEAEGAFYIRLMVHDKPRVLAGIAGILSDHGISLASLVQAQREGDMAELMLFTHSAKSGWVDAAMTELKKKEYVVSGNSILCFGRA